MKKTDSNTEKMEFYKSVVSGKCCDLKRVNDIFKALSDETRQKILLLLSHHDLFVNKISEILGIPQSSVSHHLFILKSAGLVINERKGKQIIYKVRHDSICSCCDDYFKYFR
ncbi:MAG: metalloregulator ArsR/SmtB family transcription factor [Actinobacteria bacterium]|nr:metalloregulator ArsR/SmtB family transcription factor [Actinomycetota bacterium]